MIKGGKPGWTQTQTRAQQHNWEQERPGSSTSAQPSCTQGCRKGKCFNIFGQTVSLTLTMSIFAKNRGEVLLKTITKAEFQAVCSLNSHFSADRKETEAGLQLKGSGWMCHESF